MVQHKTLVSYQLNCYDELVVNLKKGEVVLISDYSENWTILYPLEAQSMHFQNQNQVIILTVAVTVRTSDGSLADKIHLVLSDNIYKINMNIETSHQLIFDNIAQRYGPISLVFQVTNGCVGQYCSRKYLGWLCEESLPFYYMHIYWEISHGKSKGDGAGGNSGTA